MVCLISVTAACGSSGKSSGSGGSSGGNSGSAPGISSNKVKVGFIGSLTGALATTLAGADQGAQARIALQNANGGVNGRQITLVTKDDQSSPTTGLSAAQALIQQEGVFAVEEESGVFTSAYRYLQQKNAPVLTGEAIDGNEWGDPSIGNMVEGIGANSTSAPPPDGVLKLAKAAGATKIAMLSYGSLPASTTLVKEAEKAAQDQGLKVVYVNNTLAAPATGLSAIAVAVQKSGADAIFAPIANSDAFALYNAVRSQGVNIKVPLLAQVYGQTLLADASSKQAADGAVLAVTQNVTNSSALVNAVHKYTSFQGVPSVGVYLGWVASDLLITGLQAAGPQPTQAGFLTALHNQTAYTAGGLQAPVNLAQNKQGTYAFGGQCVYGVRFKNSTFTSIQGSPFCG